MKKILCLTLVLILAMSLAVSASAISVDDITNALNNFDPTSVQIEMPKFDSLSDAFDALADFLKLEGIMSYVNDFHAYMDGFYRELDVALKAFSVVLGGLLGGLFATV